MRAFGAIANDVPAWSVTVWTGWEKRGWGRGRVRVERVDTEVASCLLCLRSAHRWADCEEFFSPP